MPGVTDTQSIRYGYVTDPIDWAMMKNEADDIAAQLDAADVMKAAALGRPYAWGRRNAVLALADGATVTVPLDSELSDPYGMLDVGGANPSRITAGSAAGTGHYMVSAIMTANTTGWTRGDIQLYRNGTIHRSRSLWFQPGGSINLSGIVYLGTVGDFLDVRIYHTGGGSTNLTFLQVYIFKLCNA